MPLWKYSFGGFRLEPVERRLLYQEAVVQIRPILFDLLVILVENHGSLVSKDQFFDSVWSDTVVEEGNLTVSISQLRNVLKDESWIETVVGRGYRFTAAVQRLAVENDGWFKPSSDILDMDARGGALSLKSNLYVDRPTDRDFRQALRRGDSLVLVKGARQVGKSSLLARGLQLERENGATVVVTDLQHFTEGTLETIDKFLRSLAELISDRLGLRAEPERWTDSFGSTSAFERYLTRQAIASCSNRLIWALDEVDRLFSLRYASEFFGLIRSWHNSRALDPSGPWHQLTLAIAYATEAHLFITDLNQSPFNVGTRLALDDFTFEQAADLNERHGRPLRDAEELTRFYRLTGGHPYLMQRGLWEIARQGVSIDIVEVRADHDEWIFGDHLQRMWKSIKRDESVREALRCFFESHKPIPPGAFYRLRSAGVMSGDSAGEARPRCELYARYLTKIFQDIDSC